MSEANTGRILLVGLGPGHVDQMTARARQAVAEAEVVIGYKTYIRLVRDLLEGKDVIEKGMAEEIDRCTDALHHARLGKTVALVSSGDVGIFGMAGPTFEVLLEAGWTPETGPEVEVVPGVSALSSSAAVAGAPLTHDFCAISLSDLLTPWPTIARRLEGAAAADFVITLYNPKSSRRPQQIAEARRIFLQHRDPETPVAVVRAAYRDRERVEITTLDRMLEHEITMLTTVVVGNSSTFTAHGRMVTPRGYHNKYDGVTGELKTGEQARRSLSTGLEGWKRSLAEAAVATGDVAGAAHGHKTGVGQVLTALAEWTGDDGPAVQRVDGDAVGNLLAAAAAEAARFAFSLPGDGMLELPLAAGALRVEDRRVALDGAAGANFRLPVTAIDHGYRVDWPDGRQEAFFQGGDGNHLFRLTFDGNATPGQSTAPGAATA